MFRANARYEAQFDERGELSLSNVLPEIFDQQTAVPRDDLPATLARQVAATNRKQDAHDAIMGLQDNRTDAWVAVSYRMPFLTDYERRSLLARIDAHYAAEIAGVRNAG